MAGCDHAAHRVRAAPPGRRVGSASGNELRDVELVHVHPAPRARGQRLALTGPLARTLPIGRPLALAGTLPLPRRRTLGPGGAAGLAALGAGPAHPGLA